MGAGRRLGKAFGAVVLTALVGGCAAGGRPTATVGQGEYVNREQGFGFRIPAGFQAVEAG